MPRQNNPEIEMATRAAAAKVAPEVQLKLLIGRFEPDDQKLIRSIRAALRERFPTANELAYDYTTFIVIGYSPSEKGFESIVSLAARQDGMRLYFLNGPKLPDPKKLLTGSAKQVRYIPLESASRLKHPDVEALIAAAVLESSMPMPKKGVGQLLMQTFGGKRRPRPKAKKK